MEIISSVSNANIQRLKTISKDKKVRDSLGLYIAEGENIVKDLPADIIESYCVVHTKLQDCASILVSDVPIIAVTDNVMNAISNTKSPSGIIAVCRKSAAIMDNNSPCVVCDNIQDPGNMGTIIRTMIACGVKNLYLYGDCVDIYSPKVVRATMGGIAKINAKILEKTCDLSYNIIMALDMGGKNIFDITAHDISGVPFALVVGNESRGLSSEFRQDSMTGISLPMSGEIESLNAGVSLSIALYILNNIAK